MSAGSELKVDIPGMLKKTTRLAKTSAVVAALKAGRGFFYSEFNVRFLPKSQGEPKLTVVVSTKVDKRAVKRNRLKRIIREFVRLNLGFLALGDYVIMLKPLAAKSEDKKLLLNLEQNLRKWRLLK